MRLKTARIVFDSDLNRKEKNIVAERFLNSPALHIPATLVRRFRLERQSANGAWETVGEFANHQRLRKISLKCETAALRLSVLETGTGGPAKIFAWDVE